MSAVITKIGLYKISKATVDKPIIINSFAVGDSNGKYIKPNEAMTSLTNEKFRDCITDKYVSKGDTVFEMLIKATASIKEGFYIRELGLFDEEGDLIVITDVPVQYRPETQTGNCVTELLFSVNLKIENSNVINIKVNEQLFITIDMFDRFKNNLIESSVGIEKWFNKDNKYKDQNLVNIGIKTYALMDKSNILKIVDFPILFKNLNVVDNGDGTFTMPDVYDGTIRQVNKGSLRKLGSYEEDDIKYHHHGIPDIKGLCNLYDRCDNWFSGAFTKHSRWSTGAMHGGGGGNDQFMTQISFSSYKAGVENTYSFGGTETRMKNTAGQWYVLANFKI